MKQHPLCTDTEQMPDVLHLAVPAELKQEWSALQTRRHFLGRTGKVLGWAAMASLLGDRMRGDAYGADAAGKPGTGAGEPLKLPHFAPRAKRAISIRLPDRGGHSSWSVLLVMCAASRSPSSDHARTSFPDFWRTSPRSVASPRGAAVPSSSSNSRRAAASGSSPGSYSPLGTDQAPASRRAQIGPPGWTSSTSTSPSRSRCRRMPALLLGIRAS